MTSALYAFAAICAFAIFLFVLALLAPVLGRLRIWCYRKLVSHNKRR